MYNAETGKNNEMINEKIIQHIGAQEMKRQSSNRGLCGQCDRIPDRGDRDMKRFIRWD